MYFLFSIYIELNSNTLCSSLPLFLSLYWSHYCTDTQLAFCKLLHNQLFSSFYLKTWLLLLASRFHLYINLFTSLWKVVLLIYVIRNQWMTLLTYYCMKVLEITHFQHLFFSLMVGHPVLYLLILCSFPLMNESTTNSAWMSYSYSLSRNVTLMMKGESYSFCIQLMLGLSFAVLKLEDGGDDPIYHSVEEHFHPGVLFVLLLGLIFHALPHMSKNCFVVFVQALLWFPPNLIINWSFII